MLPSKICCQEGHGYSILSTDALSGKCKGGALLFREDDWKSSMEEQWVREKYVILFHLIVGAHRYHVVRYYIPLFDKTTETYGNIAHFLECQSKGTQPIIMGDLNANLESPRNSKEQWVAKLVNNLNLWRLSRHFKQRRQTHIKG